MRTTHRLIHEPEILQADSDEDNNEHDEQQQQLQSLKRATQKKYPGLGS